ncbi:TALE protein [Tanacetum coccineum]
MTRTSGAIMRFARQLLKGVWHWGLKVCIWIYMRFNKGSFAIEVAEIFFSVISLCAALGFIIYGGRLSKEAALLNLHSRELVYSPLSVYSKVDCDGNLDAHDSMGFGLPSESERSLMEYLHWLDTLILSPLINEIHDSEFDGYKDMIVDIREEILRKRRAEKLPGDTTSVLKSWWQSHGKWPYPTEEDKARLVQETGQQLKQINNWFINQRKRNWHNKPSSTFHRNLAQSTIRHNPCATHASACLVM